ncbi:HyaD/HybD family hydrogenase maturation endopeptidase [Hydrogenimonas thermophila]|uniref:HyaD/HybD family hydrogenase maturation endopeptidase n=1 Tax=Hydrogenimonas thermophila TaxID=223786 RepID=UPI002936DDEA|nr:HyaD/HybD family hydrogenase maturation endopeptidase [Hydrogenimonas thermophila]WOE70363.1 HyaD/HybD family hydrogenase maturation endopeptidase [Hydrogenimonas thermophila]WOE72878.1 HyaD/HybD family hydrogenase maturation endopeptidase [Hydrogenimonas thermophila]
MKRKIVVIGIGNILFKDEGVGIYAAKYLKENYDFSTAVDIIDGGTLGFKLMTYYQSYDKVIILDTVSIKDEAGSVYNLPSDALMGLGSYRQTAHEVEVVEMLEICSMLESMAEVNVIGIVPKDIESVEIDMTNEIKEKFYGFIEAVLKELESVGIEATKKRSGKKLEDIIYEYGSPTATAA